MLVTLVKRLGKIAFPFVCFPFQYAFLTMLAVEVRRGTLRSGEVRRGTLRSQIPRGGGEGGGRNADVKT